MPLLPSTLSNSSFFNLPAGIPPTGVSPNFTHPKDKGPVYIIMGSVLISLMLICLCVRAYTKRIILRRWWWDDVTVGLSSLGAITLFILTVRAIKTGPLGVHGYEVHVGDILNTRFLIIIYAFDVVGSPILWVTKFTFFLLYLQLFHPMRWMRISIYIIATFSSVGHLMNLIVHAVFGAPWPGGTWVSSGPSNNTQIQIRLAVPVACFGLMVDVCLLVLPSIAVYKLQLHKTQRLGLMLIFSTGLIAVAASAVSIYYRSIFAREIDVTWTLLDIHLMMLVEVCVGIITSCMPSLVRTIRALPPSCKLEPKFLKRICSSLLTRVQKFLGTSWSKITSSKNANSGQFAKSKGSYLNFGKNYAFGKNNKNEADTTSGELQHDMSHFKGVKTFIHTGRRDETARDDEVGIHLKHEVHCSWSPT